VFGGGSVIPVPRLPPEKRGALSTVLGAVLLKTAFWEDFFEKKAAISTKSGGTALGKSACGHGWGRYVCQVQNADIQTVPLDDYQKLVVENTAFKT